MARIGKSGRPARRKVGRPSGTAKVSKSAASKPATKRLPGRPPGSNKTLISLRLDNKVLAFLKARGPGWQTRVNAMLLAIVEAAE